MHSNDPAAVSRKICFHKGVKTVKNHVCRLLSIILLFSLLFGGCSPKAGNDLSLGNTAYSVEVDEDGNKTVYDAEGNVIAGTALGDEIEVKEDGSVVISGSDRSVTTLPPDSTTTTTPSANTGISKADTSGMEFSFSEEDTSTQEANSGTAVDLSTSVTDPTSGKKLYNITSGGVYTLTGAITDTMVTVDAGDADVTLILSGAAIHNSQGPAVFVRSADKVTITLDKGTTNTISDGSSYSITDSGSVLDAAIFSKSDLTINGSGTLVLNGCYKHGIVSKDDLVISSGTLKVTAKNVGLNGKDCVKINSGIITIDAGSDGIRADNTEDTDKGYVYLCGGTVNITSGNDGIQAETVINIENVDLSIKAGGGSSGTLSYASESCKGLKACSDIYISPAEPLPSIPRMTVFTPTAP